MYTDEAKRLWTWGGGPRRVPGWLWRFVAVAVLTGILMAIGLTVAGLAIIG